MGQLYWKRCQLESEGLCLHPAPSDILREGRIKPAQPCKIHSVSPLGGAIRARRLPNCWTVKQSNEEAVGVVLLPAVIFVLRR